MKVKIRRWITHVHLFYTTLFFLLVLDSFTFFKLTVTEVDYLPDQQHSPDRIKESFIFV